MDIKRLFTTKMFLVLLAPVLLFIVCIILFIVLDDINLTGTYGMNKTVGWAWELTSLNVLAYPLYLVYLLGYAILFFAKIKTKYILSISHYLAIIVSFLYFESFLLESIKVLVLFVSFVLFVTNIIVSLVKKQKINPTQI